MDVCLSLGALPKLGPSASSSSPIASSLGGFGCFFGSFFFFGGGAALAFAPALRNEGVPSFLPFFGGLDVRDEFARWIRLSAPEEGRESITPRWRGSPPVTQETDSGETYEWPGDAWIWRRCCS